MTILRNAAALLLFAIGLSMQAAHAQTTYSGITFQDGDAAFADQDIS